MHWLSRHRLLMLALICAFCTGLIISLVLFRDVIFADSIWSGETSFRDFLATKARRTKVHDDFVFIGIDEASKKLDQVSDEEVEASPVLQAMRREYPWPREVHARLLEQLCNAGARLVIFDMRFDKDRPGDDVFAAALERFRDSVVIGADITAGATSASGFGIIFVLPAKRLVPNQLMDDRVGYVNYWPAANGQIRDFDYTITDSQILRMVEGGESGPPQPGETVYESIDARALRKLGRSDRIPRAGQSQTIRFGSDDTYRPRSFYELFVPAMWEHNYGGGSFFKNKVVLIGSSSTIEHDVHPTPVGYALSGPLLHFHALAAALDGEFLKPTSPRTNLLLLIGAGCAAWLIVAFVRQTLLALVLQIAASGGYLAAVVYFYNAHGLYVLTLPVLGAFNLSGIFSLGYDFTLERLEKLRTRRTLERYVSKNLVKEILENPDSFYSTLRGVRIPATVLFSDIVGFTTLTESADPEALVKQLNEYLSRMTAAVFESGGTLDKFIGDAVMAVWGNVRSLGLAEDAKSAARTALVMRRELRKLNEKWHGDGIAPFKIGIGINQGEVLVGNIGSQEKMDPTVIGDSVNLASRLEGLTRAYAVDILVGPTAADLIRDSFHLRSVALVQVKGKTKPVEIFALIAARNEPGEPEFLERLETYEAGFRKFRERDFTQAKILISQFLEFYPDDTLAQMYLERALEYEKQPPDVTWNAVEVFKKK